MYYHDKLLRRSIVAMVGVVFVFYGILVQAAIQPLRHVIEREKADQNLESCISEGKECSKCEIDQTSC